jgi:hypothetical protein
MAVIVPKGHEAWPSEHPPFRVEYLDHSGSGDRDTGSLLRRVYFEGASEASAFADKHTSWGGAPSVVESRDMKVTHAVLNLAVMTDYIFSIKRFGDVESARAEFERGKAHAQRCGGRYVMGEYADEYLKKPIESFCHSVD